MRLGYKLTLVGCQAFEYFKALLENMLTLTLVRKIQKKKKKY